MRYLFIVFISVFINLNALAVPTHVTEFDISGQEPVATGITFNLNGTKMFIVGIDNTDQTLSTLPRFYADQVVFFNKQMSLQQIRSDKIRYFKRWPDRYYKLREKELDVTCIPASNLCIVNGVMDWQVHSSRRNATASGSSTAYYKIEFFNNGPRIIAESSEIFHRNKH